MVFKEDIDYEREDAHAEGLAEVIINSFRKFNATDEQIIAELMEECNLTEDEARERLACNQ